MLQANKTNSKLTSPGQLLDHRAIDWPHVLHARYWMEQAFEYSYPGPIRDLRQRLITVPPDHYGDQRLEVYELLISSPLATTTVEFDTFGNRMIRAFVPHVEERVTFDLRMVIERDFTNVQLPRISADEALLYRQPTHLTIPDAEIEAHAQRFLTEHSRALTDPKAAEAFGIALNTWVYSTMRYGRGATTVDTTAAEALELGQGLCQDYAHIMLSIFRAAGFCARYVSGHLLGEGRSHAWTELLVPEGDGHYRALAFDPTNHRRTTPSYLTVAVGRDYRDVSPTSGSFTAPYPGHLNATKRAGVTSIELRHGVCNTP